MATHPRGSRPAAKRLRPDRRTPGRETEETQRVAKEYSHSGGEYLAQAHPKTRQFLGLYRLQLRVSLQKRLRDDNRF